MSDALLVILGKRFQILDPCQRRKKINQGRGTYLLYLVHRLLIRLAGALGVWLVAIAITAVQCARHRCCTIFRAPWCVLSWVVFGEEGRNILLGQLC